MKKLKILLVFCFLSIPLFSEDVINLDMCIESALKKSNDIQISLIQLDNAKLNVELQDKDYDWQTTYSASLTKSNAASFSYMKYIYPDTTYKFSKYETNNENFTNEVSISKTFNKYIQLKLYTKNEMIFYDRKTAQKGDLQETATDIAGASKYEGKKSSLENGIELTIPLYGYDKTKNIFNDKKNTLNIKKENVNYDKSYNDIKDDITDKYYLLLKNKIILKYYEEEIKNFKEIINLMKEQLSSGMISVIELQEEEIELQNKILKVEKIKNDIELACLKLSTITGLNINENTILQGKIEISKPEKNQNEIFKLAIDKNKDLELLIVDRDKLKVELNELEEKYKPSVNLGLNYSLDGRRKNFSGAIEHFQPSYSAAVAVQYPLFDTPKKNIELKIKRKGLEMIEKKIDTIKSDLKLEILDAFFNLIKIGKEYDSILKKIELTEKNLKISKIKYEQGKLQKKDLLTMKSNLTSHKTQKLETISKYNSEVIKLKKYYN